MNYILHAYVICIFVNFAWAGPYDSSVFLSAKGAGVAGSDSSFVKSSESLFINPAGLAPSSKKHRKIFGKSDVSLHMGQHSISQTAPYITDNTTSGKGTLSPIGATLRIGSKKSAWSLGLGYFNPAGSNLEYSQLDYSVINPKLTTPGVESFALNISEFSAGIGYNIAKWLDIGVAWRYGLFKSEINDSKLIELSSPSVGQIVGVNNGLQFQHQRKFSNLVGSNNTGYLIGIQLGPESKVWGLGLTYRTKMIVRLTGQYSGVISSPGVSDTNAILALLGHSADATKITDSITKRDFFWESAYPSKMALSTHVVLTKFGLFFEYSQTNYSEVAQIILDGEYYLPASVVGTTLSQTKNVFESYPTNWANEQSIKFGAHYYLMDAWVLRLGYELSSAVTNAQSVSLLDPPSASSKTITFGTSLKYNNWQLSIAYANSSSLYESGLEDENINRPVTINGVYSSIDYPSGSWNRKVTKMQFSLTYTFF